MSRSDASARLIQDPATSAHRCSAPDRAGPAYLRMALAVSGTALTSIRLPPGLDWTVIVTRTHPPSPLCSRRAIPLEDSQDSTARRLTVA